MNQDGTFDYEEEVESFDDRSGHTEVVVKKAKGTWELDDGGVQVALSGEMTKSVDGTEKTSGEPFAEKLKKEELFSWKSEPWGHMPIHW
mmetsp:Transcript_6086/g.10939  ORF Transcript_6086/g.10939 Transcript_6086/m.10939 type:complete len:89 (-) Transcript_6086:188-454(-)